MRNTYKLLKNNTLANKIRENYFFIARLLILVTCTLLLVPPLQSIIRKSRNSNIKAFGDLMVTFNDQKEDNGPIFNFDDFKPGDCSQKSQITVTNAGENTALVSVRSENITDPGGLSQVLDIVISENSNDLYGGSSPGGAKSLSDFLTESQNPDGISLSNLTKDQSTIYTIQICFEQTAGNEYQETSLKFDLIFGELLPDPGDLPVECRYLQGKITEIIEGTEGDDRIHGSTASELILTYGGNDRIDASSGDDCIIAGDGNDRIDSESGNDVIVAGAGNDRIKSGSGDDIIFGGPGNDRIDSGSGNDKIYGDLGSDDIDSGSGNDEIYAGPGNDDIDAGDDDDLIFGEEGNDNIRCGAGDDTAYGGPGNDDIRGGSGTDTLFGESGNDEIRGGSDDDQLDGGSDTDVLDGDSGSDSCINGETLSSCEF